MKRNLNNRLKKIEKQLSLEREKKKHEIALIDLVDDPNSEYKKLLEREKAGEKVDWDRYTIIYVHELRKLKDDKERAGEEA